MGALETETRERFSATSDYRAVVGSSFEAKRFCFKSTSREFFCRHFVERTSWLIAFVFGFGFRAQFAGRGAAAAPEADGRREIENTNDAKPNTDGRTTREEAPERLSLTLKKGVVGHPFSMRVPPANDCEDAAPVPLERHIIGRPETSVFSCRS